MSHPPSITIVGCHVCKRSALLESQNEQGVCLACVNNATRMRGPALFTLQHSGDFEERARAFLVLVASEQILGRRKPVRPFGTDHPSIK